MLEIKNKKMMISLVVVICIMLLSVTAYAYPLKQTYYYEAKTVNGNVFPIESNFQSREKVLKSLQEESGENGETTTNYTSDNNISTIIKTDEQGKQTCYVKGEQDSRSCDDEIFQEHIKSDAYYENEYKVESISDKYVKEEAEEKVCYIKNEKTSCNRPEFDYYFKSSSDEESAKMGIYEISSDEGTGESVISSS